MIGLQTISNANAEAFVIVLQTISNANGESEKKV